MDTNGVLLTVLLALAGALCAVGIWTFVRVSRTSRAMQVLAEDLDARLVPLLEKADVTLDAVNAELLRVDAIVSRVEEITDRVDTTSRAVQGVANAPAEIVTDIAERVRRAWKRRQPDSSSDSAQRPDSSSGSATRTDSKHDETLDTSPT